MIRRTYLIYLVLLLISSSQFTFSQNKSKNVSTIDSCIQIALKNNYELKVYEQNNEIALKQYSIQKSNLYPTVSLSSDYSFTDQYDDLGSYNVGNAGIQIYQPIWQNGKIRSVVKRAKINSEAAKIQFSINRSNIIYYTSESYINLLRNSKINKLTNDMVKQLAITVDASKERFKLGVSKRSDVLKAETEYSNIQYFAVRVETSKKIAEQNLLIAMGYSITEIINTKDFLEKKIIELDITDIDSLISIADKNLSELKLINKRIEQQEISVLVEKKSRYPEIGAFANYNWTDNPMYINQFYGTVGVSLRLNIFNGFRKKNTIALERVNLQQMNFKEDEIRQAVINEILVAQLKLIEAREKINNAKSQIKSSEEALKVTNEEYLTGSSSMLELIDSQYSNFEANCNLVNAQAEYHLAGLNLKRKTGLLTVQYN